VQHAASAIIAPEVGFLPAYWQFHEEVTRAQLRAWLPTGRHTLVDVSGPRGPGAELAAEAGHTVLRVIDGVPPGRGLEDLSPEAGGLSGRGSDGGSLDGRGSDGGSLSGRGSDGGGLSGRGSDGGGLSGRGSDGGSLSGLRPDGRGLNGAASLNGRGEPDGSARRDRHGQIIRLVADSSRLQFLNDGCADAVIAEDRALSVHLAAEMMIAEIARVLRPAGRVLACVDSLVLGMAVLADQHHWAHLVDVPHAEVVLVPWPDGSITRCYGPDQVRELFSGAGLTVKWIRPRTVFSESMVTHCLQREPDSLPKLVRAELAAAADESLGAQLVISASKPRARSR
jgi:hypothetical protein